MTDTELVTKFSQISVSLRHCKPSGNGGGIDEDIGRDLDIFIEILTSLEKRNLISREEYAKSLQFIIFKFYGIDIKLREPSKGE